MNRVLRSFGLAFTGLWAAFKSERNFKIHTLAAIAAVVLGIFVGLSKVEWGLVVFAIGLVLAAELFNTALERLADETAQGKFNPLVKKAKDVGAAAVLVSATAALIIGILLLVVPLVQKIVAP